MVELSCPNPMDINGRSWHNIDYSISTFLLTLEYKNKLYMNYNLFFGLLRTNFTNSSISKFK